MRRGALLGELLTEAGAVTPTALSRALEQQRYTGERLGEILLSLGLAAPEEVAAALARQLGLEFFRLSDLLLSREVLGLVREELARRHRVIPIRRGDAGLVLGMVDPLDVIAIDDVRRATGMAIRPAVITSDDFFRALGQYGTAAGSVERILGELSASPAVLEEESVESLRLVAEQAPVVRLVDQVIRQAVRRHASDIHIEPQEDRLRIRYRVDGVLHGVMSPPRHVHPALISRIKIMARLNIAERRLPQDGRLAMRIDDREIDVRVSTIPTIWGEKAVLRILDKSSAFMGIERLGLRSEEFPRFEKIIGKPHGIILLTGPTGSGKTTTLYATLNVLNTIRKNIITVEDPVEYRLPLINQVQVHYKAGLTFASALRSILRCDPDIVMIGEIRDPESAQIAIESALTGHLVLSTLHTNDAPSALTRLLEMGIEPFLIASAVDCVSSQRLARRLCERCKEPYEPDEEYLEKIGFKWGDESEHVLFRARGCPACNNTGFRGRIGIYEVLEVTENIEHLVARNAPHVEIAEMARSEGMRTMREEGFIKVRQGITSLEEVLRVIM